jgi:hypothetical protein
MRRSMTALSLTLAAIPAAFAAPPHANPVNHAWHRMESASRIHARSLPPVAAAATGSRRRAVTPPIPSACSAGVVANLVEVGDLAVDEHYIYFVDGEDIIARVAKEGGSPILLGEVPGAVIVSMTTDDTRIYFATWDDDSFTGSIYSLAKEGGPVKALVRGLNTPFDLVVDGQFIYWVEVGTLSGEDFLSDGAIGRAAKGDGSGVLKLAASLSMPVALAIDATSVYFGETGGGLGNPSAGLRRVPLTGGSTTKLLDGIIVGPVTLDNFSVYYGTLTGDGMLQVSTQPKSGGTSRTLVSGLDDVSFIKVFGSTLYYVVESDVTTINAIPVAGGSIRIVRTGGLATAQIAIEDCLLYFASDEDSTLEQIPR